MQINLSKSSSIIFIPSTFEAEKIFDNCKFLSYSHFTMANYKDYLLVISGVTKTHTSYTLTRFLSNYQPNEVILVGIAGCYRSSGLSVGDIVSVKSDYLIDEATFRDNNIINLNDKGFLKDEDIVGRFSTHNDIKTVISNTVSLLTEDDNISSIYSTKYGASIENMEGASFGIIANKFNIKAYQFRAISNFCGSKDSQRWDIPIATYNMKKFINEYL